VAVKEPERKLSSENFAFPAIYLSINAPFPSII
jgi:hypothetical protein